MTIQQHYKSYDTISNAIVGFADFARNNDLKVGFKETQEAIQVAATELIQDKKKFGIGIRSIFVNNLEEIAKFDLLFDLYWGNESLFVEKSNIKPKPIKIKKQPSESLVMLGFGKSNKAEEKESKSVSGANKVIRLRNTDFSKVEAIDEKILEELAIKLWKQMSLRLKKRMKTSKRGKVNIRKTIRRNISKGGVMMELYRKEPKIQQHKLILILDVSGSMDKYSFFLLRFICVLNSYFKDIEAFIFSTHLTRITDYIHHHNLKETLKTLTTKVDSWSSGTKIGHCLSYYNRRYLKNTTNGRSITIILSDGLDTGEPEVLENALKTIKRRTKKLIWLNPLKGMHNYAPTAKGMKIALPNIDVFASAHNLESILELENILADV